MHMADIWSIAKRSEVMGRIRSSGNAKTELRLIEVMKQHRITGWRRHQPLPGKPDFTFRPERVVIFVDGCFWHGCPKCYRAPTSNQTYWTDKRERNRTRDRRVKTRLREQGWTVVRIWEHALRSDSERVAARLKRILRSALA
jgi:DNA mismatch endonuclease, patch repair protein